MASPSVFHDRVAHSMSGTPGTGAITLGGAAAGYRTFSAAGAVDGELISYTLVDGVNWETGQGTYHSAGTFSRTTIYASTNSGSAITATSSAILVCTMLSEDTSWFFNGVDKHYTTPIASDFTLLNPASLANAAITQARNGIRLAAKQSGDNSSTAQNIFAYQAIPSVGVSGGWRIEAKLYVPGMMVCNYQGFGLALLTSTTGKMIINQINSNSNFIVANTATWSGPEAFNSTRNASDWDALNAWLAWDFDGTNLRAELSRDGDDWITIDEQTYTSMYAYPAAYVGIWMNLQANGILSALLSQLYTVRCISWTAVGY